jgi:ureidoacrylate peracid hydrolase
MIPLALGGQMDRRSFLARGIATGAVACVDSGWGSSQLVHAQNNARPVRIVDLSAKPEEIKIDLNRSAVIVVDMQNDFASKGGLLDAQGVDLSIIQSVVPKIRSVLSAARKSGLKIIYLKMGYNSDLSDIGPEGSPSWIANRQAGTGTLVKSPNGVEGRILVRGTWNTEIVDALKPVPGDIELYKTRYSGFYQTELDATLKKLGVRFLIMTGCTTSVCVESTIRDAMFRDYSPILLSDCTAEPQGYGLARSNHEASLFIIRDNFGWLSSSEQFIHTLEQTHA